MDAGPNKRTEKLSRAWGHTAGLIAFLASLAGIIGFLGLQPHAGAGSKSSSSDVSQPANPPRTPETKDPRTALAATPLHSARTKGIGTIHIGGGTRDGQPMLATEAIPAGSDPTAKITLRNPKSSREETLTDALVPLPIQANGVTTVWRKDTRFIDGIKITASNPTIRLTAVGHPAVDIPVDASGKLLSTLVWPADTPFVGIDVPGPVEISGWDLQGGIFVGGTSNGFPDRVLPLEFSLDFPKPGEVLGALKGEFSYRDGNDARSVVIQALSDPSNVAASWSAPLQGGSAKMVDSREDVLSTKPYGIRILRTNADR